MSHNPPRVELPPTPGEVPREDGTPSQPIAPINAQERDLDVRTAEAKKSWTEYIFNDVTGLWDPKRGVLSNLGSLITMRPVGKITENVANVATLGMAPGISSAVGGVARAVAIAAGIYYGIGALKAGATAAFGGGNTLLDRMGPGAGNLFPGMDMPGANPYQQGLPGADIFEGA